MPKLYVDAERISLNQGHLDPEDFTSPLSGTEGSYGIEIEEKIRRGHCTHWCTNKDPKHGT